MVHINSSNLKVFPTAHPRTTQLDSRMLYEQNIANILGQFIDKDGFVVQFPTTLQTGDTSISIGGSTPLIFNLQGYYFTLLPGASFDKPGGRDTYLVAYLNTTSLDTDESISELNQDSTDGKFEGLSLEIVSNLTTMNVPYLILYKSIESKGDYAWEAYTDSLAKFELSSLHITGIDGKP